MLPKRKLLVEGQGGQDQYPALTVLYGGIRPRQEMAAMNEIRAEAEKTRGYLRNTQTARPQASLRISPPVSIQRGFGVWLATSNLQNDKLTPPARCARQKTCGCVQKAPGSHRRRGEDIRYDHRSEAAAIQRAPFQPERRQGYRRRTTEVKGAPGRPTVSSVSIWCCTSVHHHPHITPRRAGGAAEAGSRCYQRAR